MQKTLSFAKNKILLSSLRSRIFTLDFREAILKTFTKTSLATFGWNQNLKKNPGSAK